MIPTPLRFDGDQRPRHLAPRDVHVWSAPLDGLRGAGQGAWEEVLSDDERRKAASFKFAKDRDLYIAAHAALRWLLSSYADVEPAAWRFTTENFGKPRIAEPATGLKFNLSHTAGMVAIAVAREVQLGVDVEYTGRRIEPGVAERFFARPEVETLAGLPDDRRHEAFFWYWTLKEAYIKARGEGLSRPLQDFWLTEATPAGIRIAFAPSLEDDPDQWQFASWRLGPEHRAAVAVHNAGRGDVRITLGELRRG